MEENWLGHCEVSVETRGRSLLSVEVGERRDMVCTEVMDGRDRRVESMLPPWWNGQSKASSRDGTWTPTTRPVEPIRAVDVIVASVNRL